MAMLGLLSTLCLLCYDGKVTLEGDGKLAALVEAAHEANAAKFPKGSLVYQYHKREAVRPEHSVPKEVNGTCSAVWHE